MARINIGRGLDEYLSKLGNLEFRAHEHVGKAIYYGADIVADSVKSAIDSIPSKEGGHKRGVTDYQRKGLKEGLGIAKMRNDNGMYNVKVGFDGYNGHPTKTFPKGQPNALIARALEKGTSFAPKTPFIDKAVRRVKAQAEEKMRKILEEEIQKTMN